MKAAEVMLKCTQCQTEIRATKKNIEAMTHFQSRHPTSTWSTCFPGTPDPSIPVVESNTGESSSSSGAPAAAAAPKKKKPTEDLSFLDSALDSKQFKKK